MSLCLSPSPQSNCNSALCNFSKRIGTSLWCNVVSIGQQWCFSQKSKNHQEFLHYFTFILFQISCSSRTGIMWPPGLQCCSEHLSGWGHRLKDWSASCCQNKNKPGPALRQWPLLCCCLISSLWSEHGTAYESDCSLIPLTRYPLTLTTTNTTFVCLKSSLRAPWAHVVWNLKMVRSGGRNKDKEHGGRER